MEDPVLQSFCGATVLWGIPTPSTYLADKVSRISGLEGVTVGKIFNSNRLRLKYSKERVCLLFLASKRESPGFPGLFLSVLRIADRA
jgi:hypothetical protein